MKLWSPHVTWAALLTGIVSLAIAIEPVLQAVAGLKGPIAVLFGDAAATKIEAAASIVLAIALVVAARGRSIAPNVDAGAK